MHEIDALGTKSRANDNKWGIARRVSRRDDRAHMSRIVGIVFVKGAN